MWLLTVGNSNLTELRTDSAPSAFTQRKKQWYVLSLFWISLELQTENLLMTNERAHDISSARLACLVAKDFLEVVLQETLVRPFSSKQFERGFNFTNCCILQIAPFLQWGLLAGVARDRRGYDTSDQESKDGNLHDFWMLGWTKGKYWMENLNS